ncbi:hypothetical protein E4T50_05144 [Aureobasidium sp. EXF-12298]|nr:hypothetical protein E4T50_05144 [Aureobasidium sp. EXF-12298]
MPLFDNKFLSDVTIKFGGQELSCHKVVLARKSEYFYRAFSSQFSVASSNEVDLGDDEEPEAIRAMIRHMYDLPYDQVLEDNTADDSAAYSTNEDLLFHIGVFTTADKYDVASLRPLVVKKFEALMETNWESETFATSIQKLTGPSAGHLADTSLQATAAAFCTEKLPELIKNDAFVKMIQDEEPFAGRLLTGLLRSGHCPEGAAAIQLKTCLRPDCLNIDLSSVNHLSSKCIVCGTAQGTSYRLGAVYTSGLVDYKKVRFL